MIPAAIIKTHLTVDSFNLERRRLLPVFISSLSFIILFAFGGNLIHFTYADTTITAAGDWGCNSNTDNTVDNMDAKNPALVFGLGDYSYISSGSCWWTKVEADISSPVKITFGNHEDESGEGLSGYKSHFGISQTYYAYTQDVARVIVMDTDVASPSGSAQKSFVQSELQSASSNPSIKWIIVYLHKPFYTSPNSCSSSGCTNSDSDTAGTLRNNYGPMFDQYGVDLVLQGHVHNYQRTFQLKYDSGSPSSPTIGSNNAGTYTEGNGAVYAIVGTGGQGFHPLSNKASFVSKQQDDDFGQMQIKVTNSGNTLEGKYYENGVNDNNVLFDTFTITKAVNSPPVANNQAVIVTKDTAKAITLTATDPNNNPLTYSIVTQPAHGTLSPATPGGPARTYTPTAGYTGSDSFTFKANDGTVDSNTAMVSITVQVPPQGTYNYAPGLVLTGSNYNDSPSTASLQLSQFSVAAWFKTSANFGGDAFIVNKGGFGSESAGQNLNYGIWMASTEQIVGGFETSSGGNQFVASVNAYNDGQWHYAVLTNDGTTLRLYVDGIEVATKLTAGASPESSGTKPVRVGANSRVTPPDSFFTGEVDEVRVWNDDLTAQQAADAFAGTSFNTGAQVLHLPFGGGGGGGYNFAPGLVLTGSNYDDTPSSPSLQLSQFSVAAWFKTSANFGSDAYIANKGGVGSDSSGENLNYGIWMNSAEQIKAGFETSTGSDQYVTSVNTYNDGQWHYAVVTKDVSVRLYIDGVQVATKSTSGIEPESSGTKPVRVGANSRVTPSTNFFTGEVDEVRVWNDDLSATQVAAAFAGTDFNTGDQVLYLSFGSASLTSTYNYEPSLSLSGPK
jgi:concanavalin A-like lectin/glucanase superfamily protein/Big-like domain-containing protein/calcineurin-like phosphoesterase family protein